MMPAGGGDLVVSPAKPERASRVAWFGLSALIFALDQATKVMIRSAYSVWDSQIVVPGFFNIIHAENPGAAFSMLADAPGWIRGAVLIGLAGVVAIGIVLALLGKFGMAETRLSKLAFAMILGGALGNLLDRVFIGTVTDFLEFYWGRYYFPAFNVADSAISVGAALLILDMWIQRKAQPDVS